MMDHRAKMNEKYAVMTPFNIIQKMLGPYMFGPTSRETLGDKMELYFQDYSFVPLFVQVRTSLCLSSTLSAPLTMGYDHIGELSEDDPGAGEE